MTFPRYNSCVTTFRQFIEMKFLEWQQKLGSRKTVKQFAEYIGVGQTTVSGWWNDGHEPQGETVTKLAKLFGVEVYDVLGLPRPEENLIYLQGIWDRLSERERRAIREQAEKYVARNNKKD